MRVFQFKPDRSGINLVNSGHKIAPFPFAMEVVHHQESTAIEIPAQPRRLRIGKDPVANSDGKHPRPVVNVITVDVDNLFNRAGMYTREPLQAHQKLAVRLITIDTPPTV